MKIVTVVGARPQFIKASVVSAQLAARPGIAEVLVHTGQHYDSNMSDVFFDELGMRKPDVSLSIGGGGHGEMTGRMLIEIERVLLAERPDVVLVYGDTNSTLAGALAAAKLHVPVAHVEAGLRSFNMRMPEEINRILTDRVSTWLFAPTVEAVRHLANEGITGDAVLNVGDVMFDVALHHGERATQGGRGVLDRLDLHDDKYILATVHRAENTDDSSRLQAIVAALSEVATQLDVIWPLHPRTRAVLERAGLMVAVPERLRLIEPQGYLDMVRLERAASLIVTDSGGVQKEAFFHRVPCVTLREETEWMELVTSGWNRLAAPNDANLMREAILGSVGSRGEDVMPYGQGDTAARIVEHLVDSAAK